MSGFDVPDFSGVTLPTSSSDTNRDDWDAAADAAPASAASVSAISEDSAPAPAATALPAVRGRSPWPLAA
jgi:hypothetical protein